MDQPRTSLALLQKAWKLAKKSGLNYVYMGNVLTTEGQDTTCPKCGEIMVQRTGYHIKKRNLTTENKCGKCGEKIHLVGSFLDSK